MTISGRSMDLLTLSQEREVLHWQVKFWDFDPRISDDVVVVEGSLTNSTRSETNVRNWESHLCRTHDRTDGVQTLWHPFSKWKGNSKLKILTLYPYYIHFVDSSYMKITEKNHSYLLNTRLRIFCVPFVLHKSFTGALITLWYPKKDKEVSFWLSTG